MTALELTPEGQLRVMPLSVIQELIHERNTLREERDEAFGILKEINHWINVAVMRPPTPNEAAYAINTWGDKIRPILEATE